MNYETIRLEVSEGIATLTLNRPDRLNAWNPKMMSEMLDAFDRIDRDDDIGAVIVTGEGRAFCAGADLEQGTDTFKVKGASAIRPDGSIDYSLDVIRDGGGRLALRIFDCLKPVIAAVNGPAVGVGVTMTLPMDIRIASDTARMGFVFARRGAVPEATSSFFLPRLVGISQALEWCYSGKLIGAAEAERGGLLRSVHPADELLSTARALARELIEHSAPVSRALVRQMMWKGLTMSHPMEAHRIDSRGLMWRGRSADIAEGVSSFLEKRPPAFPDRVSKDMPDYFPWWEEQHYF